MTKTYFTTLVRNRETKRKEEKIVAGDMFKIKKLMIQFYIVVYTGPVKSVSIILLS